MDIKSARAELSAIQAKLGALSETRKAAGNRDYTDAEITTIEQGADRATELKAAILTMERGLKAGETMRQVGSLGSSAGEITSFKHGAISGYEAGEEATGYINASPAAVKASIKSVGVKALVVGGSAGAIPVSLDNENIVLKGRETPVGILSYLQATSRKEPTYTFLRESKVVNNADIVAEGATKPTSEYEMTPITNTLDVITHLSSPVPVYLVENDAPSLERYLTSAMTRGVFERISELAVAALQTASGAQTVAAESEALKSIFAGLQSVETLGYVPSVIILNKADWKTLATTRNSSGAFDLSMGAALGTGSHGPNGDNGAPTIFNVPVLVSSAATAGQAIVVSEDAAGISLDAAGVSIRWDESGPELFDKNLKKARVETRAAIDITSPAGIALVDLTA